ncbi:MAG: hypothetical protein N2Z21_10580 [Candidatus Sumerlaeaceae bacterium]|nr:hypothetical protein [Candidatus Sumerlaeaceae bacterium]
MQGTVKAGISFSRKIFALVVAHRADAVTDSGETGGIPEVQYVKAGGPEEALQLLRDQTVDVVLVDGDEQDWEFENVVSKVTSARKDVICAVVTEAGNDEMWIRALNAGACDLLEKRGLNYALCQLMRRQGRRIAA